MNASWIAILAALIAAVGLALVIGRLLTLRAGLQKGAADFPAVDPDELGLSRTGPTIMHFSAQWCGPCKSVRRAVDAVCEDLPTVAHREIDLDANPELAQQLSVLSLPTTLIFDAGGQVRYRSSGVPTVADLRRALEPLLA